MTRSEQVFAVTLSSRIWHVTLNGAFFGAYRSKENALKGVDEAQQALSPGAPRAKIVISEIEDV